jgi:hypothetical protein
VARPNPARPGPAQPCAPLAPHPPCALSSPLSLIWISRAATSLPHLSLSPRGALGFGVEIAGVGSRGEPSPLLSLSLSPSPSSLSLRALPLLSPARARPCAAARPAPPRRRSAGPSPSLPGAGAAPARPRRGPPPRRGGSAPARGLGPLRAASRPSAWLAWPWHGLALPRLPLTRSRVRNPHARGDYSWFLVGFKLR